jgi:hypothetical protein
MRKPTRDMQFISTLLVLSAAERLGSTSIDFLVRLAAASPSSMFLGVYSRILNVLLTSFSISLYFMSREYSPILIVIRSFSSSPFMFRGFFTHSESEHSNF